MAFAQGITGFKRVANSLDPNKVYAIGPGGKPVDNPEELIKLTGASNIEEATKFVDVVSPEEARTSGIRLPGTEKLFADQPDVLTPEMLDSTSLKLPEEKKFEPGTILDSLNAFQASLKTQIEESSARTAEARKGLEGSPQTSTLDLINQQSDKFGIPETLSQIKTITSEMETINNNIINLQEQKELALLKEDQRPGAIGAVQGLKANIERQYNSRISAEAARASAKAATINALQGNISTANQQVKMAVDAITYDEKVKYDRLSDFYEMNYDELNRLGSEYSKVVTQAIDAAKFIYEDRKKDTQKVMDYMVDAASNGVTLGIDPNTSTVEEAAQAYQEAIAPIAERKRLLDEAAKKADIARTMQLASGGSGGGGDDGNDKVLDILAVTRYNELYPEAGVIPGDTESQANAKVAQSTAPGDLTDEDFRSLIRAARENQSSYEQVINEINNDKSISNKDRGLLIASEIYGVNENNNKKETSKETPLIYNFLFGQGVKS